MTGQIDETHDPRLRSWIESANEPTTDFPIQNLPFGIFRRLDQPHTTHVGVAIGDKALDLHECHKAGLLSGDDPTLSAYLGPLDLSRQDAVNLRQVLSRLLRDGNEEIQKYRRSPSCSLDPIIAIANVEMLLPVSIGDYTDFYASLFHATNIGRRFRPDNPLLPNYKWVPIGYHGRASSIVISGTPINRPSGQTKDDGEASPRFGATRALDYELELGMFVGEGNEQGAPISIEHAEDHVLGYCLVNDWSARDLQKWEYQPLGPFLSKSFATTISPWIVTPEALAPFRVPAFARAAGDPQPLAYLYSEANRARGGLDITLEVFLLTEGMRQRKISPYLLSQGNARDLYWTFAQMLTHHASNGCNVGPGDLIASGTVSGATAESRGCLMEITEGGTRPISLPNGEARTFLQDGDEVILRGYCQSENFRRIGFGECRGLIGPGRT
jgi:fumarylacetoacetase